MGKDSGTSGSDRRAADAPRLPEGAEAAIAAILDVGTTVEPADEGDDPSAVVDLRVLDLRPQEQAVDPYYDLGAIAENEPLTENLFTTASD